MIHPRSSMKPSKKCCGEKRTRGLYKAGPEVTNSDALFSPKTSMHDGGSKPWQMTFAVWRQTSATDISHVWSHAQDFLCLFSFATVWSFLSHVQTTVTVHLRGCDADPVCLTDLQFIYLTLFIQTFFFFTVTWLKVKKGGIFLELKVPVALLCCLHSYCCCGQRVASSPVPVGCSRHSHWL